MPQDRDAATLAPKIKKEDGKIDWTTGAAAVDRKVRAFTPKPSAYSLFRGKRLIILRGGAGEGSCAECAPGEITSITKEGLVVGCGGKTLYRIERLQPESKRAMDAYSFSLSGRVRVGDRLD